MKKGGEKKAREEMKITNPNGKKQKKIPINSAKSQIQQMNK